MNIEQDQHDDTIDKVLAALRNAPPPEGMEARIAQHLAQHPAPAHRSTLRDLLAAYTPAAAWWRGAITGAAVATFAICAVLLVQSRSRTSNAPIQTARTTNAAAPFSPAPQLTPASQNRATPCSHPTTFRVATSLPAAVPNDLRAETYAEATAPSRPAPELPLTPQERTLARLARTATPQELATLDAETRANQEAEEAIEVAHFFAPPPPPPAPEPKPEASPEASPEENQPASPEPGSPEAVPPATE